MQMQVITDVSGFIGRTIYVDDHCAKQIGCIKVSFTKILQIIPEDKKSVKRVDRSD
jgi:hypothetical protein